MNINYGLDIIRFINIGNNREIDIISKNLKKNKNKGFIKMNRIAGADTWNKSSRIHMAHHK